MDNSSPLPRSWKSVVFRSLLWLGFAGSSLVTLSHLLWIASTPKGFWVIPHIKIINAPPIPAHPTVFEDVSIPFTQDQPAYQGRISPYDLKGVKPGTRLVVIDCMFLADNQPTVFRLTPFRLLMSYPVIILLMFSYALFRPKLLTPRSSGPGCAGPLNFVR